MRKKILFLAIALPACLLLAALIYQLPPVHDRLAWRVDEQVLRVRYWLNPPEEMVFVPQGQAITPATPQALAPSLISTASPTPAPTQPGPTETPLPSPTPTITPTALPGQVSISGVRYEDQHGRWNYCAPANLAMALSFWGWDGNRDTVGPVLKPDGKDKNVMPYEMVDYIEGHTDLKVASRMGGDLDLLKRFLAAGYPVLIEKGTYLTDISGVKSWMGHYEVITGYDETEGIFIGQDSYVGADQRVPQEDLLIGWRAFNYSYLIVYHPDKEAEVMALLGPDADPTENFRRAAQKASDEIFGLTEIDQFFAWFNRGTSLVQLQDYAGGAQAYDEAFAVYPSIEERVRPWRMMWYQTGPYFAYYYTGRYYDVLSLADRTLEAMQSEKNLEETYYWRGMAKAALGDTSGAIEDYRSALQFHTGFEPAVYQLQVLGATP